MLETLLASKTNNQLKSSKNTIYPTHQNILTSNKTALPSPAGFTSFDLNSLSHLYNQPYTAYSRNVGNKRSI